MKRANAHWEIETFRQRMLVKDWQKMLLEGKDTVVFRGRVRQLTATSIGHGVLEVHKTPLEQSDEKT